MSLQAVVHRCGMSLGDLAGAIRGAWVPVLPLFPTLPCDLWKHCAHWGLSSLSSKAEGGTEMDFEGPPVPQSPSLALEQSRKAVSSVLSVTIWLEPLGTQWC